MKGLPGQLISQPSLQRAEHPPAEALPRQSVQLHHAGLDALLQTDAFIQVTGVSAVVSRAVFAAYIVGTVAKAAADASASARMMTGWRHHLHLHREQGREFHKISRQANQTPFLKIKRAGVLLLKLRPMPCCYYIVCSCDARSNASSCCRIRSSRSGTHTLICCWIPRIISSCLSVSSKKCSFTESVQHR